MAGKKWLVILGIINVLAIAGIIYWYVSRDSIPPVISREETIVYEETMAESELLQGVVAVDAIEGDVSDTLVVEKVTVNQGSGTAVVTYGAMDQAGNIAKQSFQMEMKVTVPKEEVESTVADSSNEVFTLQAGEAVIDVNNPDENMAENSSEEATEVSSDEEAEEDMNGEEAQDGEDAEEENEAPQEQPAQNTEQNAQPQDTQPQVNPEEIPVINFGSAEVVTKKGYNPAWVTVISQMYDNKDTYQYLLQHLVIHGEFNNAEVGAYDVNVSTVDGDGYESEAKAIRIIVEE